MREVPQVRQLIDEAIKDSANGSIALHDLLRRMLIVGSRVGSEEIQTWARNEIYGYSPETPEDLPHYRRRIPYEVTVNLLGIETDGQTHTLRPDDVPDDEEIGDHLLFTSLPQPVSELVAMAKARISMMHDLHPTEKSALNRWLHERRLLDGQSYILLGADRILPRPTVDRVCDHIRATATELCLAAESNLPDSGDEGPSSSDPAHERLASISIDNSTVQIIYGNEVSGTSQQINYTTVTKNDHEALMSALTEMGFTEDEREELSAAIDEDGGSLGKQTESFVKKVRNGAADVVSSAASGTLTKLLTDFIGLG